MQATSHALHPMHVLTSTSLATFACRCVPAPGMGPGWPEIFWMRRVPLLMVLVAPPWPLAPGLWPPSCLLHLHQKPLELGRVGVGIDHRGRELIGRRQRRLALVLRDPAIAPVDRNPDLVG